MYLKDFVTGYGVRFESSKRNQEAYEKAQAFWNKLNNNLQVQQESVILFCGAKNNGKSSLVRHVLNSYLSSSSCGLENNETDDDARFDAIDDVDDAGSAANKRYAYYVDFDPGQPEMETPGSVSGHLISSDEPPLTKPTYLNMRQHQKIISASVGGTNMSVNPQIYIHNCRLVFNRIKEYRSIQNEKGPIFINTMGFIRNVGLLMLIDLIKICKPNRIVVLNVENDPMRTVYADLNAKVLAQTRAAFFYETAQGARDLDYQLDVYNLEFSFNDSSTISRKSRTALQLAYMGAIPEALYKPIMHLSTKWISMDKVVVYCVSSYPLKEAIVLDLLYHSWVHLVKLRNRTLTKRQPLQRSVSDVHQWERFNHQRPEGGPAQEENASLSLVPEQGEATEPPPKPVYCKLIDEVLENELIGCGIVADIDLEHKRFAVITPLEQASLDTQVDCLIKPLSIQVPREALDMSTH